MKKCPICKFDGVKDAARCPKCQSTLTTWINLDQYSEQAYKTALFELSGQRPERAAELLLQAIILSPEEHTYLSAYGRVLGQLGRYAEAALVLEEAWNNGAPAEIKAAIDKAKEMTPTNEVVPSSAPGSFMGGPTPSSEPEQVEPEFVPAEPVYSEEHVDPTEPTKTPESVNVSPLESGEASSLNQEAHQEEPKQEPPPVG
ncbi:MAG: hypothetical protein ACFCD0_19200 [Gemmataceae bacterium]